MRARRFAGVLLAMMIGASVGVSSVATAGGDDQPPVSVIVYLNGEADLTSVVEAGVGVRRTTEVRSRLVDFARRAQRPLLGWLAERGADARPFHIANAVLVRNASPHLVRELAARSDVRKVTVDKPVARPRVADGRTVTTQTVGANIAATGAPNVWALGHKGQGVVIGSLDTGVQWDHPALKSQYRGWNGSRADHGASWHDAIKTSTSNPCGTNLSQPCDDQDHGTHTTGTAVGSDGGENQIGMAPGAKWIACRAMDQGVGKPSTYLECLQWFLAPYPQHGTPAQGDPSKRPDVINMSAACPVSEGCTDRDLRDGIRHLVAAGIVVVTAAGNSGPACGSIADQPATLSAETLSVGAYDHRSGAIASFSSRGPSKLDAAIGPDVTAPGVSIRSAVRGSTYRGFWSNTEAAAAHVAGEVALLLSAKPGLRGNVAEITRIVTSTASPKTSTQTCGAVSGSAIPNNTWGHGTIDAHKAVTVRP